MYVTEPTDLPDSDAKHTPTIGDFPSLSRCRELRELEVTVPVDRQEGVSLIASITSIDLQKIVFVVPYGCEGGGEPGFEKHYDTIDDCLCQLVGRLQKSGYKHRLEMVFRIWTIPHGWETGYKGFFQKFREQGCVKFVWRTSDTVVYCSDGKYSSIWLDEVLTVNSKVGLLVLDFASLPE